MNRSRNKLNAAAASFKSVCFNISEFEYITRAHTIHRIYKRIQLLLEMMQNLIHNSYSDCYIVH